jgi:hypothetical protein
MRHFWVGFLVTGLFLVGLSAYERRQARGQFVVQDGTVAATSEDGTPIPQPDPPPKKR